jgi:hypothetical protein
MLVQKTQRALVVVNEVDQSSGDFQWLYTFAEAAGRADVELTLRDDYGDLVTLYDANATSKKLLDTLKTVAGKSTIKQIDLFVMFHGNKNTLAFAHDEKVDMSDLKVGIKDLNIANKLRMVYSTACYGSTHIDEFVSAGFSAAIGSVAVNANGAVEFPIFTKFWSWGWELDDALGMTVPVRQFADDAATAFGRLTNRTWQNA